MPIRIPATIGGSTVRISNEFLYDIDPPYDNYLISYGPVNLSTKTDHGGWLKPRLGSVKLTPKAFTSYPPPQKASFPLYWDTDLIVDADAHLKNYDRTSVTYSLLGKEYTNTVSSPTTYNDTLINIFTAACTTLSLTLDSSSAAAVDIYYQTSKQRLLVDILDEMASYANHGWYVAGTTLHLVDAASDNGTLTLDEFDFKPASYPGGNAYKLFSGGDYTVLGSSALGQELSVSPIYSNVQAKIEAQLARTKAIMEKPRVSITIPLGGHDVVYGQKISFTDQSLAYDISVSMWARSFKYDLGADGEWLTIEGEADIT